MEVNEEPYWIPVTLYVEILDALKSAFPDIEIIVTFDDGNDSDLLHGVPALSAHGIAAEIFVLTGHVGKVGYLSRDDLMHLDKLNVAIGSHGVNHVRWDTCGAEVLRDEIEGSIARLGEMMGRKIDSVSLPFGRYNMRVLRALRDNGVVNVYSSDGGPRLSRFAPIPRFTVRQNMTPEFVVQKIARNRSLSSRIKTEIRSLIKSAIP